MLITNIDDFSAAAKPSVPFITNTFNNPSYLKNTVEQLTNIGVDGIIIIDNNSSYPPMIDLLRELSKDFLVLMKDYNSGPRDLFMKVEMFGSLPQIFYLTDPDMAGFNNFPDNFHEVFCDSLNRFNVARVGSALLLDMEEENILDVESQFFTQMSIRNWEQQFYNSIAGETIDGQTVYHAPIDTTFCLYDKDRMNYGNGFLYDINWNMAHPTVRVGGHYTLEHLGWRKNPPVAEDERKFYLENLVTDSYPHAFSTTEDFRKKNNV